MRKRVDLAVSLVALIAAVPSSACVDARASAGGRDAHLAVDPSAPSPPLPAPPTLALGRLFDRGPGLVPSAAAQSLDGKRVRMVGFMVDMEYPPQGAWFLAPYPVTCVEAGGGTADLPPERVLVLVESASGRTLAHVEGPLEAIGTFEVGNQSDSRGRRSNFKLTLEEPPRALPDSPASGARR